MKNTGKLNLVPEQMAVIPKIQEAFSVANSATLTPEELHELEQEIFFTHDMIAFEAAMAAKKNRGEDERNRGEDKRSRGKDKRSRGDDEKSRRDDEKSRRDDGVGS